MPWTVDDVDKHIKGLTPEQKKEWVKTANAVRDDCLEKGGEEGECDAKAVRVANGAVENSAAPTVFDMMIANLSVGDYAPIRSEYWMATAGTIREYLYTEHANTLRYTQRFRAFINEYFPQAFELGYTDGGGEMPAEKDDQEWLASRTSAERQFADLLFQNLKDLKKLAEEEGVGVFEGEAEARADGYAKTLDAIYSEGKIRGAKNMMLTFGGPSGIESCPECVKLMGQRHRASWWIGRGLVPGQPGNTHFSCGGWQCQHYLWNDRGEVFNV